MLAKNEKIERCLSCGRPLVERTDSRKFKFQFPYEGILKKITLSLAGNELDVECVKCKKVGKFSVNKISLGMSYELAVSKK